jgi:hypothetical protein
VVIVQLAVCDPGKSRIALNAVYEYEGWDDVAVADVGSGIPTLEDLAREGVFGGLSYEEYMESHSPK